MQREKLVFELVKPYIPGFSVEPMEVDDNNATDTNLNLSKRKSEKSESGTSSTAKSKEIVKDKSTVEKTKKLKK